MTAVTSIVPIADGVSPNQADRAWSRVIRLPEDAMFTDDREEGAAW